MMCNSSKDTADGGKERRFMKSLKTIIVTVLAFMLSTADAEGDPVNVSFNYSHSESVEVTDLYTADQCKIMPGDIFMPYPLMPDCLSMEERLGKSPTTGMEKLYLELPPIFVKVGGKTPPEQGICPNGTLIYMEIKAWMKGCDLNGLDMKCSFSEVPSSEICPLTPADRREIHALGKKILGLSHNFLPPGGMETKGDAMGYLLLRKSQDFLQE